MIKFKKIAFLAMTTLALAACGGGGDTAPEIDAAPHIKATVGDTAFNALADVYGDSYTDAATKLLVIRAEVIQSGSRVGAWAIHGIPSAKGKHPCKPVVSSEAELTMVRFFDYRDNGNTWYYADGMDGSSCSITVKQVSETEVSGFFTATLLEDNRVSRVTEGDRIASPATLTVTQGSFRVPLDGPR